MIAYDIESLVKIYPGQAVPANKNISFQVREGEIFGILGENGAWQDHPDQADDQPAGAKFRLHSALRRVIALDGLRVPSFVGYMPQESLALNNLKAA